MSALFRVCLPVDDLEKASAFYAYLFHLPGERVSESMHCFRLGDALLACHDWEADGLPHTPPHTDPLYIAVKDPLDVLHQRVMAHGAFDVDPAIGTLPTGEKGFYLYDPCGNRIALVDANTRQWGTPVPVRAPEAPAEPDVPIGLEKDFLNAVKGGNLQRVQEMLLLDPDLASHRDSGGTSAVMHALYKQHPRVAAWLAEQVESIDLWEACSLGRTDRVAELLDADPSQLEEPSADGFLPLGLGCYFGHPACVELILERGADVNRQSQNARHLAPIHSALGHRNAAVSLAIARRLIAAGADVNLAQQGGYTPLHQAADRGDVELVKLLLDAGADARAVSANGRRPLELARAKGHAKVVAMLGPGSSS